MPALGPTPPEADKHKHERLLPWFIVTIVLPSEKMIEIREYIDREGGSPYAKWFKRLSAPAAAKVVTALVRMEQGNLSNTKSVGAGVF